MAKTQCAVCSRNLGVFSIKTKISDGAVCNKCLNHSGIAILNNPRAHNQQSIKEMVNKQIFIKKAFHCTKSVGIYLILDESNQAFKIGKNIFSYDHLLSYELLEDDQSIIKGGLGSAVAGGLLFGGVGAIVGGVVGKRKTNGICSSMKIRVSLKNTYADVVYINFIAAQTKTNTFFYKSAQSNAQKCITLLETIIDLNRQNSNNHPTTIIQSDSVADEIIKFKSLLDQGIITQEEFDKKKKELLGL